ncbi:metal-dependent transcriptional regulator [Schaalia sp. Marseille-Q2122]|uniref:metal-dependent transcriptional regulator n=1 Tax=Schaalia sp. Marseille-Q2122 TaxID=2736604 RepID=UPI00158D122A|nr:metal-dependent transcriptional regulator [Schaalia sp. Marseille-Q2122]
MSTEAKRARTAVTEDYLKAIWSAETRGQGISINELAAKMGVVPSTASENVSRLKEQGLVDHAPYQKVHLSDEGRAIAVGMVRRHRIIETYLHEALGFEWDEVHVEAEILEHAISDRLLDRLDQALGYPTRDPHGDPIPTATGEWVAPLTRPLSESPAGDEGVVARISDRNAQVLRDLERQGIAPDVRIRVVQIHEGRGLSVTILGEDSERRVVLGVEHVQSVHLVAEEASV